MDWKNLPAGLVYPDHCLLLIVDVQNDFCARRGALGRQGQDLSRLQAIFPPLNRLIKSSRRLGVQIAFMRYERNDANLPGPIAARNSLFRSQPAPCRPGTWGAQICKPITPKPGEPVFTKNLYSAFSSKEFVRHLERSGRQTLVLAGVLTNVCVDTTARDAELWGYNSIVITDCVASDSLVLHKAALTNLDHYFSWLCRSEELVQRWQVQRQTQSGRVLSR